MMASLLTANRSIRNVPRLRDVKPRWTLLARLGVAMRMDRRSSTSSCTPRNVTSHEAPYDLVKTMRASFFVLGPLLARAGRAGSPLPADARSARARSTCTSREFARSARESSLRNGYVEAHADRLDGARIWLDNPSVGATENIMMAAVLAARQNHD